MWLVRFETRRLSMDKLFFFLTHLRVYSHGANLLPKNYTNKYMQGSFLALLLVCPIKTLWEILWKIPDFTIFDFTAVSLAKVQENLFHPGHFLVLIKTKSRGPGRSHFLWNPGSGCVDITCVAQSAHALFDVGFEYNKYTLYIYFILCPCEPCFAWLVKLLFFFFLYFCKLLLHF